MNDQFDVILFDLGGVLIELTGVPVMLNWMNNVMAAEQLWEKWLSSPSVRKFETGRCSSDQFANSIVKEFKLPVTPKQFIQAFTYWPKRLYPGAIELLERLGRSYKLATLSNTNELHWNRFGAEFKLTDYIKDHFLSFQLGLIKPDIDIFNYVIKSLTSPTDRGSYPAERILFFDDNQLNIDSARKAGMTAYRVAGISELSDRVNNLGLTLAK